MKICLILINGGSIGHFPTQVNNKKIIINNQNIIRYNGCYNVLSDIVSDVLFLEQETAFK